MRELIEEAFVPYLSQLGLKETENPNRGGITYTPDRDLGTGFFWTYPVKNLFCITAFDLTYYDDISYQYRVNALLNISKCTQAVAAPVIKGQNLKSQNLIGYYMENEISQYTIKKKNTIKSIGISIHPDYYNKHLSELYDLDFSAIPKIVSTLDGTFTPPAIDILLNNIVQTNPASPIAPLHYEAKLLELMSILLDWNTQNEHLKETDISSRDIEYLDITTAYISNHLSEDLNLNTLATISCMGKTKLTYLFKKIHGITVLDYVQSVRIETAKRYLLETSYSIQKIAALVGYKRQSSFTEFFKNKTGYTPLGFKKEAN
ncbi:MAG: helix-turn-helix domain-containing protein [Lachnospiraceae bacterium]